MTDFKPNPTLTSELSSCLATPSTACDITIGSTAMGSGYCSNNNDYVICACVNSTTACPQYTNPYCGNSPSSYKATYLPDCSDMKFCVNSTILGGSNNNVESTTQICSDADVVNVSTPLTYMLFIVLFIITAVVLTIRIYRRDVLRNNAV